MVAIFRQPSILRNLICPLATARSRHQRPPRPRSPTPTPPFPGHHAPSPAHPSPAGAAGTAPPLLGPSGWTDLGSEWRFPDVLL